MPKKILRVQVYETRPTIRWLDNVLEDLRRMDVKGYTEMAMNWRLWRRLVLEARAHVRL